MSQALSFREFSEATAGAVPTVVGYDLDERDYIIGEGARQLGVSGRPVAEDFKRYIGDTDAAFEGKPTTAGPRPRLWSLGEKLKEPANVSTRQVAHIFFERLFAEIPDIPKKLIVGVPATDDEIWQTRYRSHIRQLLEGLGQEQVARTCFTRSAAFRLAY